MTSRFNSIKNSIINNAQYIHSPNYDLRPVNTEIDLLVIHGISLPPGEFSINSGKYITDLFTNKLNPNAHPYFKEIYELKVSCHCLIRRNGKLIQYVPFKYRAWHAGNSCFNGRTNCNDFSIGIELEGTDNTPYTEQQYKILSTVIKLICSVYKKITVDNIVGHSNIAPGRKTDPGDYFDWGKLHQMIK
jgi:N-acetyl-anhydromuramoyl-L-alanine amidase